MTQNDSLESVDLSAASHRGWGDIRGWLLIDNLPAELQQREDATQNADHERRHWRPSVPRTRPATDAERCLLSWLGFTVPPDLVTVVKFPSGGVRRREWPALSKQLEEMQA